MFSVIRHVTNSYMDEAIVSCAWFSPTVLSSRGFELLPGRPLKKRVIKSNISQRYLMGIQIPTINQ